MRKEGGGNIMKEQVSQIEQKYKEKFFDLHSFPEIGKKVIYLPSYDSMIYALHDGAYESYKFTPGDALTIKWVEKDPQCNSVFVDENECTLSPAELVPADFVDEADIKTIKEIYQQKLREKIEKEKK